MDGLIKKILTLAAVIGLCFSVYFYFDSEYAKADEVVQLASKVDHTDLGLKIIMLENILEKRREQLKMAQKAGATDLAESIATGIADIQSRIKMLEQKALE